MGHDKNKAGSPRSFETVGRGSNLAHGGSKPSSGNGWQTARALQTGQAERHPRSQFVQRDKNHWEISQNEQGRFGLSGRDFAPSSKKSKHRKWKTTMTFKNEMNLFFARNCYSEQEREKVQAWPAYRRAMDNNDPIEAQEIATRVQEGKESNRPAPIRWTGLISVFAVEQGKWAGAPVVEFFRFVSRTGHESGAGGLIFRAFPSIL
jgi:hypothetical protein